MPQSTEEQEQTDQKSGNQAGQGQPNQDQGKKEEKKPVDPAKKRRGLIIGALVVIVLIVGGVLWYMHAQTYEDTDDAQVDGHLNPLASRVAGTVKAVYVDNNMMVEAGKPLVDLDPKDSQVALAQSQAEYQQSTAQLRAEDPNVPITRTSNVTDAATANAEVANAQAALAAAENDYQNAQSTLRQQEATNVKAQSDLARYTQLIQKHEVAQSEFDQYASTAKSQEAVVDANHASVASAAKVVDQRRAQLLQQQVKLDQTIRNAPLQIAIRNANVASRRASVESSAAQLEQNKLNLSYTHIVAPVGGIITQRSAEVGARISVGQQLMMIVQLDDLWVTANFKETQLRRMRVGQHVTIKVDALDQTFSGYIENMPAATGSRTSILPPENATGNYVKVVQRLPMRIRFNANQDGLNRLRPGMSVEPTVHFE